MEDQVREEQVQVKEGGQKALYMFAYSKGFLQALLAATTFAGGYFIGVNMVSDYLPFVPAWIIGSVIGILFMFGIDGQLDAAFAALQDEKETRRSQFLALAVFASLATGGFTAFAGWVVGESKAKPTSIDEKREYVNEMVGKTEDRISVLIAGISADSAEVEKVVSQWKADTAAVLSAGNESHVRLYRSGGYKAQRYQSGNYQTMQAFCANLDTINAKYESRLSPVIASMNQKKAALSAAMSADVAGQALGEINAGDAQRAKQGEVWKFGVWYADVLALMFVWIGFIAQRKLKKSGAKFNVRTKSIWIAVKDWADNMANSASDSSAEVTSAMQELFGSVMSLVAWVIGLISYIITAPTRIDRENIFLLWEGLTKGFNRATAKGAETINLSAEKIPDAPRINALKNETFSARTVVNFMGNSTQDSTRPKPLDSAHYSAGVQRGEKSNENGEVKPLFQRKTNARKPNKIEGLDGEEVRLKYGSGSALKKVRIGNRWYNKRQLQQKRRNALNYAEKTDNNDTAEKNFQRAEFLGNLIDKFE